MMTSEAAGWGWGAPLIIVDLGFSNLADDHVHAGLDHLAKDRVPEDENWPYHRIASTNQRTISMGTT